MSLPPAKISKARAASKVSEKKIGSPATLSDEKSAPIPFFNRELSWLAFNRRVLEQATNPDNPLCERMKFLAFVTSNLDEFFEIRVSGIMQQIESGISEQGPDHLGPREQLRRIHSLVNKLVKDQYNCWLDEIIPAFAREHIIFGDVDQLTPEGEAWIKQYFEEQVYPVLTPLAIDHTHPFPHIINKSLNIMVGLRDPKKKRGNSMMAIIPVPRILPRVVRVEGHPNPDQTLFVFLSDIIRRYAQSLFPGYTMISAHAFRITRNSDLYIDEEEVDNLLLKIEEELYNIRKGDAVRLEIREGVDEELLHELRKSLQLEPEHTYLIRGNLNLTRLMAVYDEIDRPDLKFPPFIPRTPKSLRHKAEMFSEIRQRDIFLHHPFDSFTPVVEFVEQAAHDPAVFAIKQTLYRTSGDSPIIDALKAASINGKQVTVLVELKARFDEANNIAWARQLEDAGAHVVYGIAGLKTHCKCALVVRRESGLLRRYAHLGTGNYNPKTAKLYTDCSIFTAEETITREVSDLFNALTGFGRNPEFTHLLCAPYNLHSRMQELILQEAENAKAGKTARIFAKCNSLIDSKTIENLYKASQAGVQIDLLIRGICGLVPGLPGLSDNIRVHSILGRYLEHSRIYYFENSGGSPLYYMGSADWMPRNFFRRIEVVFPVLDRKICQRLSEIIDIYQQDNVQAKMLNSNGSYTKASRGRGRPALCAQSYFEAKIQGEKPTISVPSEVLPKHSS